MAEYLSEAGESNYTQILADMFADYQARMPGWSPNPGAPEVVEMEVFALRHATLLDVFQQVKALIFTDFGVTVAGVPFGAATAASVDATVVIAPEYLAESHEIPAGLRVTLEGPEGPLTFAVSEAVIVGVGTNSVAVTLIAEEPGAAGSGLTGPATLLDPRAWIKEVTLLSETAGGADEEDEATYRNRLVAKERRDSPTIITAVDAQEAILEIPGVGRCLIIDNYVPKIGEEAPKEGVPGAFTAVLIDENGQNVSSTIKAAALALVEGERLLDLTGHAIDPTRTDIAIQYAFTIYPGFDEGTVKAVADAAVTEYLDPAKWGSLPGAGGTQDWADDEFVRYGEVYTVLNNAAGLNHVTSLLINGVAHEDIALAGPGALPNLTSIKSGPTWDDATKTWDEVTQSWDDATVAGVS